MKLMNIGIVCYPTFGGSGVVATELGKALAKKGHKVHFITYSQPVRLPSFTENTFYHEVSVSDYPLFDYQPYELVLSSRLVDVVRDITGHFRGGVVGTRRSETDQHGEPEERSHG